MQCARHICSPKWVDFAASECYNETIKFHILPFQCPAFDEDVGVKGNQVQILGDPVTVNGEKPIDAIARVREKV